MQEKENGIRRIWQKFIQGQPPRSSGSDDPEVLLQRAQDEMQAVHRENRERAVQAITQKNNLQTMLSDARRRVEILTELANAAELRDDPLKAMELRRDTARYVEVTEILTRQLHEAEEVADQVKRSIQSEEELILRKTAEALSLRVQWKAVRIEQEMARWEIEQNAVATDENQHDTDEALRYVRHRKLLIEATIGANHLSLLVEEINRQIEQLGEKADSADDQGNERLLAHLLRLREQYEATAARMQTVSERAEEVLDRTRTLLEAKYESLRKREIPIPDESEVALEALRVQEQEEDVARQRKVTRLLTAMGACVVLLIWLVVRW